MVGMKSRQWIVGNLASLRQVVVDESGSFSPAIRRRVIRAGCSGDRADRRGAVFKAPQRRGRGGKHGFPPKKAAERGGTCKLWYIYTGNMYDKHYIIFHDNMYMRL